MSYGTGYVPSDDAVTPSVTASVTPPEVEGEVGSRRTTPTTTNVGESRGGGGQQGFEEVREQLQQRGVSAGLRPLLEVCSLDGIRRTIADWDIQQAKQNPPGPGVLVGTIRRGGVQDRLKPLTIDDRNRVYGEQCATWVMEHFPELCQPSDRLIKAYREAGDDFSADQLIAWGPEPHPAAVAAVFRLHQQFGKGKLTKTEHAPAIRAAVRRWEDRLLDHVAWRAAA